MSVKSSDITLGIKFNIPVLTRATPRPETSQKLTSSKHNLLQTNFIAHSEAFTVNFLFNSSILVYSASTKAKSFSSYSDTGFSFNHKAFSWFNTPKRLSRDRKLLSRRLSKIVPSGTSSIHSNPYPSLSILPSTNTQGSSSYSVSGNSIFFPINFTIFLTLASKF